MRQIDRLLKYAGNDRQIFKSVWHNGQDWSFYMKPLTIAEKNRATKDSRKDDSLDFALHLLCLKAMDENGPPQYNAAADLPIMRARIESALLDKLMLAILGQDEEDHEVEGELDIKSPSEGTPQRKRSKRTSRSEGAGEDAGGTTAADDF